MSRTVLEMELSGKRKRGTKYEVFGCAEGGHAGGMIEAR